MAKVEESRVTLDTTDVDRHLGQPVGGGQLKEPVAVNDIRRWVQGMQYANPLHYDDVFAAKTRFGRIVAPQSFTICCDVGHGAGPAIVGSIPGTHMIFGGDEWWFGGPRILPGDLLRMERRLAWIRSNRRGETPPWGGVDEGMQLPRRAIGPHTIASFATEWRSYTFTVWGSSYQEGPEHLQEAGWLPEMERNLEAGEEDPALTDGLYRGPSRGHADEEHAQLIGMPRGYGYGASMGAWVLDYVAYWAGHDGFVRHSNVQYRFPAFEGDVTYLDAEVTGKRHDETLGVSLVTLEVVMSTQDGAVMAKGPVEVQLPE